MRPASPQKILLTGATGYLGSHLVPELLKQGYLVSVLGRKASHFDALPWSGSVNVHTPDCTYPEIAQVVRAADPDVVVHLASKFLVSHVPDDIESMLGSNLLFGALLAEAMVNEGKRRLINASTYWTHFQGKAYSPVNLYAASKRAFFDLLEYYSDAHGLQILNLELYDTYGPDDKRRKILNILIDHFGNPDPLALSPGMQKIDLLHIDDVSAAMLQAVRLILREDKGGLKTYQVRSGKPRSLRELVKIIEKNGGAKMNAHFGGRDYRPREVMEPFAGGRDLPGWKARISLADGIKDILAVRGFLRKEKVGGRA